MRKSWMMGAAIICGIGLGALIAILLSSRSGTFCPLCGSELSTERGSIFCKSCGVRLRIEEPQA